MSGSCEQLAMPGVRGLQAYVPGADADVLQRELGITNIIKLASNENALGCGELARQALASLPDLARYPDSNAGLLRDALCKLHGVDAEQLVFGNGSNDVLELAVRAFAGVGRRVLCPKYSFTVFTLAAQAVGAELDVVDVNPDFSVDVDALLDAVQADTSILLLANPNNPTGAWLDADSLMALLHKVPQHLVVVIDEAYAEYLRDEKNYQSMIANCAQFPKLLVSRTFSKIHGLAGLRMGYGVTSPMLANYMNRVRQPFNCNSLALLAAHATLADFAHINESLGLNNQGRQQWLDAANDMGLATTFCQANFVCLKLPLPGKQVARDLQKLGVLLRPLDNYGMPDYLRVTFGLPEENQRGIAALRTVLDNGPGGE